MRCMRLWNSHCSGLQEDDHAVFSLIIAPCTARTRLVGMIFDAAVSNCLSSLSSFCAIEYIYSRRVSFERSFILDIRNSYYGYLEKLFQISEINVSFWISKIVILDIRNNNSGYPK